MTDAYLVQLRHQLDQARRDLRAAEDELAVHRQHRRAEDRLRAAWRSARRRAATQYERAELLLADHVQSVLRGDFRAPHELAVAKAALAALHEGEEPYEDECLVPTPAQWIWHWNRATPARRLDVAGQIRGLSDAVDRCVLGLHEQRIAELQQALQGTGLLAVLDTGTEVA